MKILGLIPARGGSKGVVRKNIKPLGGIPLIGHTIKAAKEAGCLDRLWVSTEDAEVAAISETFGVPVPWLRPAELAQDDSSIVDVILHLLARFQEEGYQPDGILLLQPTSPFRRPETIHKALELFRQSSGETIMSVVETRNHPHWCYRLTQPKRILESFIPGLGVPLPRQKLPPAYILDGSIFLIARTRLLRDKSFHGGPIQAQIVPSEEGLEIDTPLDWETAEGLLRLRQSMAA